tara:strand:+ start:805 stop:951 length:147 start_codon:yes stop_codon:yes gene_type:complete
MNEDHIIAAILAAGLISQNKDDTIEPKDAVGLYGLCLTELIASNRSPK